MQKIILVGYMAVGKTTIGQLLAQKLQVESIDLDKLIERETNLTISNIFDQKGEIFFRKIEHNIFKEIIQSDKKSVISSGGGTPCYADNHLLLNRENVVSVYLKASIDTIFERLKSEKKQRPLVANLSEEELKEFIAIHLFERSYFYNQATFTISVDNKNPEIIAQEIINLLN